MLQLNPSRIVTSTVCFSGEARKNVRASTDNMSIVEDGEVAEYMLLERQ